MITPELYLKLGNEKAQKIEDQKREAKKKIENIMRNWLPFDHISILNEVIKAHAGAQKIRVIYDPPGLTLEIAEAIKKIFYPFKWNISINKDPESVAITIDNFVDDPPSIIHYSGYPYLNFKYQNGYTTIKFTTSKPTTSDINLFENLIELKDYIKVELYTIMVSSDDILMIVAENGVFK